MNIGELEQRTGLSRANIRFYEKEGLLSPKRGSNQYREFTEEDAISLKKILLLRQLQTPIPTIKQIIQGEVLLCDALQEQKAQLTIEQEKNQMASMLIGLLLQDKVGYQEMDVATYEAKMKESKSRLFAMERDVILPLGQPWRRFLARNIDLSMYALGWNALLRLLFRINFATDLFTITLQSLVCVGMMLLVEPMLLSTIGTTPGKWLFGLVVRDGEEKKLSHASAWHRTWQVAGIGSGYGLPFYGWYREYRCFVACQNQEELPWEQGTYAIKDTKKIRFVGWVVSLVVILIIGYFIPLQAMMPKYRGDLTAVHYYANANDMMNYMDLHYGKNFNEEGEWIDYSVDGTIYHYADSQIHPTHHLTLEDGKVVGVSLVFEEMSGFASYVDQKAIALISFLGARHGLNCIELASAIHQINQGFASYSFEMADVQIRNEVEYQGYQAYGDMLLPIEGELQQFHMVFSLEQIK